MSSRKSTMEDGSLSPITVGNLKLKFTKCYSGIPSLDLKHVVRFSACTYGGPIALAHSHSTTSWFISIRTSGGTCLKDKIEIPDVFTMEWTRGYRLVVVDRRGNAKIISSLGEHLNEFNFNSSIREVKDVRFFNTAHDSGVALMDDQHRVFLVNSVTDPFVWIINNPVNEAPSTWAVFQPSKEVTRTIVVIERDFYIGGQGEQLKSVDTSSWTLPEGQYAKIAVNNTRDSIAVYHSSKIIQIVTADLFTEISRVSVPGDHPIFLLGWLGDDGLFLQSTPTFLQIFSASDPPGYFELNSDCMRVGIESDGLKIYTNTAVELVTVVSKEESDVLGVASDADGALLHEASQMLTNGRSHQAYEYINQIRDLSLAVNSCIAAATSVWNPTLQKSLLKAAKLGMAFANSYDTENLVRSLRELRVLNALRHRRVGIPITYSEFTDIGISCLVNRIIDIGAYGTAIEISQWLKGDLEDGIDRVLLEWVRRTINAAANAQNAYEMDMEALELKLSQKLLKYPHVSIGDAAKRAIDAKLPKLARLLIKRETDDSKQVQVLLQLGDIQEALKIAAGAQRPQLLHQVIRHLMANHQRPEYELAIRKIPLAQCIYQDLVKQESGRAPGPQMLALLEQASDFERQTMLHLDAAVADINPKTKLDCLKRAKDAACSMGDKAIEEVISDMVAFFPSQTERNQAHMTIRETVIEYAADTHRVQMLKSQAKLSDKQVWLWTIEGLCKQGKMDQLLHMSQKKSPVGYLPFIKACMKYGHHEDCKKYFNKITGYNDLISAHLAMRNFVTAGKMAFDRRDRDTLQFIYTKAHSDKESYQKVGNLLRSL